ncbi:MAG: GNAT family N-acetyltransferase [Defluviitaleaceae bacterium]|nr:GNAT family N-acetyltransferase [Defluviitaleaceae bacterium]
MIQIRKVNNANEKSDICNSILRALPDWFGIEASIADYVQQVKTLPFIAAYDDDAAIGFAALKPHTKYASEICVMGILSEHHRRGIGRQLVTACEQFCRENEIEFLTVKTLADSRESKNYEKTRLFYMAQGFKPIEVFPTIWDEENPCLLMIKAVAK